MRTFPVEHIIILNKHLANLATPAVKEIQIALVTNALVTEKAGIHVQNTARPYSSSTVYTPAHTQMHRTVDKSVCEQGYRDPYYVVT